MLKIIKLSCLVSIFFVGELYVPLYAQEAQDSTATTISTTKIKIKGILVKGVVKDAKTKKALSGINIAVEGFSAVITNDDGTFEIKVPNLDALLSINGQGFQSKVFAIKKQEEGIEIFLSEANYSQTYQMADLAAGDKLQYNTTNAATVVNFDKDQWSNPVNQSVGGFLQGKVAGLNTVRNS